MSAAKHLAAVQGHHTLDELFAEVRAMRELLERLLPAAPAREWLTVEQAAGLLHRTPAAVRARCRMRGIGVKVRGAWRIDKAALLSQN